jgi:acyltransferase
MRQDWVDSLKGMAIVLVVIGHLNTISNELNQYIYSFHMPLFFFISGYLINFEKYIFMEKVYLFKRSFSLITPYFFFSVISYIFYIMMDFLYQPQVRNIEIFGKGVFFNLYVVICCAYGNLINTPLWFLPCLFITEIFFFISRKHFNQNYKFLALVIIFSLIGFLYSTYIPLRMPWGIDIAFTGIVFYSAGYFFRNKYENIFFRESSIFVFSLFLMHILLSFTNPRVDMYKLIYNDYFLFYVSAFSGILFYIYIFKTIRPSKILQFYGKNSLIVLGLHYLIISTLKYILPTLFNSLNLQINESMFFVVNVFLTLFLVIPVIIIINRCFPYVTGKSQQRTKTIDLYSYSNSSKDGDPNYFLK